MSTTLGCRDIEIRKSEFVAKTQFYCFFVFWFHVYLLGHSHISFLIFDAEKLQILLYYA